MICPKCEGLAVREDENIYAGNISYWRCINCGQRSDYVIQSSMSEEEEAEAMHAYTKTPAHVGPRQKKKYPTFYGEDVIATVLAAVREAPEEGCVRLSQRIAQTGVILRPEVISGLLTRCDLGNRRTRIEWAKRQEEGGHDDYDQEAARYAGQV